MGSNLSAQDTDWSLCFLRNLSWASKVRRAIFNDDIEEITQLSIGLDNRQPAENDIIIGEHHEPAMLLAVQRACENRLSVDTLKAMIKLGFRVDVFAEDRSGVTPLYTATKHKRPDLLELLLAAGANPNCKTYRSYSPLFMATASGSVDCTRILLSGGANPNNLCNPLKGTSLHMAALSGHKDLVAVCRLLLDYGCDISLKNSVGRTALASACGTKRDVEQVVNFLLDEGAKIDEQDDEGMTPLMRCLSVNNRKVARLLIRRGANLNLRDIKGQTAADIERKQLAKSNTTEPLLCVQVKIAETRLS